MSKWEPKIEKGIPMPPVNKGGAEKYPFHKLEISESIFYPDGVVSQSTLHQHVTRFNQRNKPKRVSVRKIPDAKGCRVWRLEDDKKEK